MRSQALLSCRAGRATAAAAHTQCPATRCSTATCSRPSAARWQTAWASPSSGVWRVRATARQHTPTHTAASRERNCRSTHRLTQQRVTAQIACVAARRVMVSLTTGTPMIFGATEAPCAFGELISIGSIGGTKNAAVCFCDSHAVPHACCCRCTHASHTAAGPSSSDAAAACWCCCRHCRLQISAAISGVLQAKLNMEPARFYLKFTDVTVRSDFGWNGKTF